MRSVQICGANRGFSLEESTSCMTADLAGLELKIESRGVAPLDGGEVVLGVPILPNNLSPELLPPEDVGVQAASMLLGEIENGGVVDSSHQGLLFLLCALCPPDVSKVRVGKLTPFSIGTLRNIRDFLGVKFVIKPDPVTNTVILKYGQQSFGFITTNSLLGHSHSLKWGKTCTQIAAETGLTNVYVAQCFRHQALLKPDTAVAFRAAVPALTGDLISEGSESRDLQANDPMSDVLSKLEKLEIVKSPLLNQGNACMMKHLLQLTTWHQILCQNRPTCNAPRTKKTFKRPDKVLFLSSLQKHG
ncbi:hypothetical protein HPP92_027915 [Vanilla planifolia]|uniref:RNA 3'-terminal phosphate cyclase domain-containing protein n=1 Tax=Vanilla planifolia TaxID=51239 RepID=A0A835P7H1_VANPL|nr:hypothetical protein HPP92_027915 [Vanilla planifolia]